MLTVNNTAGIVPVVRNDIPFGIAGGHSDVAFTAACFAGPGMEWSLAPLQKPEDVSAAPTNVTLVSKLRGALRPLGADRLFAPTPTKANGEIIEPTALKHHFRLGNGVIMFRNPEVPADGTFLRSPGDAGIFSAGGCGVIVATMDDHLVLAHAARESLIDKPRVITGQSSRHHESVVDAIVSSFCEMGYEQHQIAPALKVWMLYFIKPRDFFHHKEHPQHWEYNSKVGPYLDEHLGAGFTQWPDGVRLDLPTIAAAQFKKHGVLEENIHLDHAYLHDELPHTRKEEGGRYLVAIVRR